MDDTSTDDEPSTDDDHPAADDGSRLDELGDRITSARSEAAEAVEGVGGGRGDGKSYADSGEGEAADEDDQTIAPPG